MASPTVTAWRCSGVPHCTETSAESTESPSASSSRHLNTLITLSVTIV